jgi:hypothetical protein
MNPDVESLKPVERDGGRRFNVSDEWGIFRKEDKIARAMHFFADQAAYFYLN